MHISFAARTLLFDGRSSSEPGSRHFAHDRARLSAPESQMTYETSARPQRRHKMVWRLGFVVATVALVSIPIGPQFWSGLQEHIDGIRQLQGKLLKDDRASKQPPSN